MQEKKDLSNDTQIRLSGSMVPKICMKMLRNLIEKLRGKISCKELQESMGYATVNSSSAHPPWANPRALVFFTKNWQIPQGGGYISCLNALGCRQRKRANAPSPGSSPSVTSADFVINQCIKHSTTVSQTLKDNSIC